MGRQYEWKRPIPCGVTGCAGPCPEPLCWEYETTDSSDTSPEGEGWQRVYSFGLQSMPGAGGSPSRYVKGK